MKKVFAHYYTPTPPSINNAATEADSYYELGYLNPYGENNAHVSYGGYLRDKPVFREQLSGDYRLQDAITEIAHAKAAGIDGFTLNILTLTETDRNYLTMVAVIEAARLDGEFDIVLMPDMGGHFSVYPEALPPFIESIASNEAIFKLPDGRLLLSPYNAQNQEPGYWVNLFNYLESVGIDIAFMPVYQGWSQYATAFQTEYPTDFAKYFYGVSDWGVRTPTAAANRLAENPVSAASAMGLMWMQSVRVQDFRPKTQVFGEAKGSELLRVMYAGAIDQDADFIQLVTWNDYGEHTHVTESARNSTNVLDLLSYYNQWFKEGVQPTAPNSLYLISRNQLKDAVLSGDIQTTTFADVDNETPVDIVDILTITEEAATLETTFNGVTQTFNLPAGVNSTVINAEVGTPRAALTLSDGSRLLATGSYITNSVDTQDFLYEFNEGLPMTITATLPQLSISGGKRIAQIEFEDQTIDFSEFETTLLDVANNISLVGVSDIPAAFEPVNSFSWSSGETAQNISITAPSETQNTTLTRTVTVTNDLGETATETVTVNILADNGAPSVTLTANQTVEAGSVVTITATGTDPENDTLTYAWRQISGTAITLEGTGNTREFTAPSDNSSHSIVIGVIASDGELSSAEAITTVSVNAYVEPTAVQRALAKADFVAEPAGLITAYSGRANIERMRFKLIGSSNELETENDYLNFDSNDVTKVDVIVEDVTLSTDGNFVSFDEEWLDVEFGATNLVGTYNANVVVYSGADTKGTVIAGEGMHQASIVVTLY